MPAGKFRRYHGQSLLAHLTDIKTLFLNGRDFSRLIAGLHSAEKLIGRIKPDIIFSKGGYVAVPVGLAGHLRGVPIVTHDSDTVPGLANRIIGRWAVVHATGMPPQYYSYPKDAVVYTGIPIDERVKPVTASLQEAYKKELGLPADAPMLLAAGGGQGAQQINRLMLAIVPRLLAVNPRLRIVHIVGVGISGQMSEQEIKQAYTSSLPAEDYERITTMSFTSDFHKYSGAADLIITRAGASALAEFALQAKACIVIPGSVLAGGHQLKNAQLLKKLHAVKVLPADAGSEQLLKLTSELLNNPSTRTKMAANLSLIAKPNAAKDLAAVVLEQARKNRP